MRHPMSNTATLTAEFKTEKETKNTIRFAEQNEETEHPIIGSLYLSKVAVAKLGAKNGVRVTVAAL